MDEERTPIIVGVSQLVDREADVEHHIEPLAMLTRTARGAAENAGGDDRLLERLDTIALVGVVGWHPQNPVRLIAERLGAHPQHEYTTGIGGQVGVTLTNFVAERIMRGESELAVVVGCNNLRSLMRARAAGVMLPWIRGGEGEPELIGGDEQGTTRLETAYGMAGPPEVYPLFENALRARLGLGLSEHAERMGRLFARFTEVAAANPYAWFPVRRSAQELTTVTDENRMISYPYPKFLNAILNTDQSACLLMTSVARARTLGIGEEKWIYWWGGAHSQEEAWWASERPDFATCPSMRDTILSALANAHVELEELDLIDFYSCFPIAVEMACEMAGLDVDDPRGFTVTGGLPYAGGPASAYTLHSLASMVERLRERPGARGLVTGNGWYLTKHSATVLAGEPMRDGTPREGLIDPLPSAAMETAPAAVAETPSGPGRIETYTVSYDRSGEPIRGIVLGRTAAGARFLANTPADPAFLREFVTAERVGQEGTLRQVEDKTLFDPA